MTADAPLESVLPIESVIGALRDALRTASSVVLQAPPGAGKTTRVPLALLDETWLAGSRILMLEPRRLATRAAARRMAATLRESVGESVGFRVRGESRVGPATRIEVVTEGVLTRMLLRDPALESVGLVIFDEFHERSIHAELGLALTLQTQDLLRPDLRILVMSATLDGVAVSSLLGGAPIVTSESGSFPVEVHYAPVRAGVRIEDAVSRAVRSALDSDAGSILAFLPGAGEIRRCLAALERSGLPRDVRVLPLYGDLPASSQDIAIAPTLMGTRKIVLATSIAETSLTIDGVRVVVDCGLSRVSRFNPRSGMSRLETVRVSRSSADQRTGRAGRTSPGVCYRLWAGEEQGHLAERARPEILETDLTALALDLAAFGVHHPASLRWIDPPPIPALKQARDLLRQLDALDEGGRITGHGREMSELSVHPRLAHMLIRSVELGVGATACVLAALLEERDVIRRDAGQRDIDVRSRVSLLGDEARDLGDDVDRDAVRRVRQQSAAYRTQLRVERRERVDEHATGQLLALAYPERVAQRRIGPGDRYLLRNGTGAVLSDPGVLAATPYLAIADLDGVSPQSRIYLAAPLDRAELEVTLSCDIEREDVVEWDATAGSVTAVRRERLGAIILRERPLGDADPDRVCDVLLDAIARRDGVDLSWSASTETLIARVRFLRSLDPSWPDWSDTALRSTLATWLRPHLSGLTRRGHVERLPLTDILLGSLGWEQRARLEDLAPTHAVVPTGSRIPIDYSDAAAPFIAVRLQEMFGLRDTPRVGGGAVALTLQLLSPAHRPVQVTRDLAGFWRSSYFDVRKDLRGRYPKHEWPEDPMSATPTRKAKKRS